MLWLQHVRFFILGTVLCDAFDLGDTLNSKQECGPDTEYQEPGFEEWMLVTLTCADLLPVQSSICQNPEPTRGSVGDATVAEACCICAPSNTASLTAAVSTTPSQSRTRSVTPTISLTPSLSVSSSPSAEPVHVFPFPEPSSRIEGDGSQSWTNPLDLSFPSDVDFLFGHALSTADIPILGDLGQIQATDGDLLLIGSINDNQGGGDAMAAFITANGEIGPSRYDLSDVVTNGGDNFQPGSGDAVGSAILLLPDLDGNGINEILVGSKRDDYPVSGTGSFYMLNLEETDGSPISFGTIDVTRFGQVASVGQDNVVFVPLTETIFAWSTIGTDFAQTDLNSDGHIEVLVGAPGCAPCFRADLGVGVWNFPGAFIVVSLNTFGGIGYDSAGSTMRWSRVIDARAMATSGITLGLEDEFGYAIAPIGDVDLDGREDFLVGAPGTDLLQGAVYIVSLSTVGTTVSVKWAQRLELPVALPQQARLGSSVAQVSDLNDDGVAEIAIGAPQKLRRNDVFGTGTVFIASLNTSHSELCDFYRAHYGVDLAEEVDCSDGGPAWGEVELAQGKPPIVGVKFMRTVDGSSVPSLALGDAFGESVAFFKNGEIPARMAVGAPYSTSGSQRGAIHLISLPTQLPSTTPTATSSMSVSPSPSRSPLTQECHEDSTRAGYEGWESGGNDCLFFSMDQENCILNPIGTGGFSGVPLLEGCCFCVAVQSSTSSLSMSSSRTVSSSVQVSASSSSTVSPSATSANSLTHSQTQTLTHSHTSSITNSQTNSLTKSQTNSQTRTQTNSKTKSQTISHTYSQTYSPTGSSSVSLSATSEPTSTPSSAFTSSARASQSASISFSVSASLSRNATPTTTLSTAPTTFASLSISGSTTVTQHIEVSQTVSSTFSMSPTMTQSTTFSRLATMTQSMQASRTISSTLSRSTTTSFRFSGSVSVTQSPEVSQTVSSTLSKSPMVTQSMHASRTMSNTLSRTITNSNALSSFSSDSPSYSMSTLSSKSKSLSVSVSSQQSGSSTTIDSLSSSLSLTLSVSTSVSLSPLAIISDSSSSASSLTISVSMSVVLSPPSMVSETLAMSLSLSTSTTLALSVSRPETSPIVSLTTSTSATSNFRQSGSFPPSHSASLSTSPSLTKSVSVSYAQVPNSSSFSTSSSQTVTTSPSSTIPATKSMSLTASVLASETPEPLTGTASPSLSFSSASSSVSVSSTVLRSLSTTLTVSVSLSPAVLSALSVSASNTASRTSSFSVSQSMGSFPEENKSASFIPSPSPSRSFQPDAVPDITFQKVILGDGSSGWARSKTTKQDPSVVSELVGLFGSSIFVKNDLNLFSSSASESTVLIGSPNHQPNGDVLLAASAGTELSARRTVLSPLNLESSLEDMFGAALDVIENPDQSKTILVGAPLANSNTPATGMIHVFTISNVGNTPVITQHRRLGYTLDDAGAGYQIVLTTNQQYTAFGQSLNHMTTSFGRKIVIAGAPGTLENAQSYKGALHFLGESESGIWSVTATIDAQDMKNVGVELSMGSQFGYCVELLGNIHGNGFQLLIGAPGQDSSTGTVFRLAFDETSFDVIWAVRLPLPEEFQAASRFGSSIVGLGDSNGDGSSDVAIGRPSSLTKDDSGNVFIVSFRDGPAELCTAYATQHSLDLSTVLGFDCGGVNSAQLAQQVAVYRTVNPGFSLPSIDYQIKAYSVFAPSNSLSGNSTRNLGTMDFGASLAVQFPKGSNHDAVLWVGSPAFDEGKGAVFLYTVPFTSATAEPSQSGSKSDATLFVLPVVGVIVAAVFFFVIAKRRKKPKQQPRNGATELGLVPYIDAVDWDLLTATTHWPVFELLRLMDLIDIVAEAVVPKPTAVCSELYNKCYDITTEELTDSFAHLVGFSSSPGQLFGLLNREMSSAVTFNNVQELACAMVEGAEDVVTQRVPNVFEKITSHDLRALLIDATQATSSRPAKSRGVSFSLNVHNPALGRRMSLPDQLPLPRMSDLVNRSVRISDSEHNLRTRMNRTMSLPEEQPSRSRRGSLRMGKRTGIALPPPSPPLEPQPEASKRSRPHSRLPEPTTTGGRVVRRRSSTIRKKALEALLASAAAPNTSSSASQRVPQPKATGGRVMRARRDSIARKHALDALLASVAEPAKISPLRHQVRLRRLSASFPASPGQAITTTSQLPLPLPFESLAETTRSPSPSTSRRRISRRLTLEPVQEEKQ